MRTTFKQSDRVLQLREMARHYLKRDVRGMAVALTECAFKEYYDDHRPGELNTLPAAFVMDFLRLYAVGELDYAKTTKACFARDHLIDRGILGSIVDCIERETLLTFTNNLPPELVYGRLVMDHPYLFTRETVDHARANLQTYTAKLDAA